MSQPLVIDSTLVFQLFGDPAFYLANPCFLGMEEQGRAVHKKYLELVQRKQQSCKGCTRTTLEASLGQFAKLLKRMHEAVPAEVERLMVYLTGRLGSRPDYLLLYYKDRTGEVRELRCGRHEQGGSDDCLPPVATLGATTGVGVQ